MTATTTTTTSARKASQQSQTPTKLVAVIDEGGIGVRFSIYTTPDFQEVASHKIEVNLKTPKDGWFEQDPNEIITAVYKSCEVACAQLKNTDYHVKDIVTIGITNQRETTIVWDSFSGQPLFNALVWNDIRSNVTVDKILARFPDQNKNYFKQISGLPVSAYFSALKIRWLIDNVPAVSQAISRKRCKVGTIDSWIVWKLTKGRMHITDVTNASRTLLMNIETTQWDPLLLKTFGIQRDMLPEIRSSSEIYGRITDERFSLKGLSISGIMGNQQAGMLGQMCIRRGVVKSSYRSGCFLLCNTGQDIVNSSHGLLTTVAYKLGPKAPTFYALEGAVAVGGHALDWLQNKVRIMPDKREVEKFAGIVPSTGGVYFVPAFTGLYAPYWRKDARGIICGLTQFTTKHHIVRAALEAICFQCRDILEVMYLEAGFTLHKLHVDGPLSSNNLLMQLQADIAGVAVERSTLLDCTTVGAAMCAAQAEGIELFEIDYDKRSYEHFNYDTFLPTNSEEECKVRYGRWKRAVERSFGWVVKKRSDLMTDERYRLLSSIPPAIFVISAFVFLVHSSKTAVNS